VGPQRIIERESRWARPAAAAAFVAALLVVGSNVLEQSADLKTSGPLTEQLRTIHDNSGTVVLGAVLRGVGFLALFAPLLYLFRAAQARSPRVHPAMIGFAFLGPILLAGQGLVFAVAEKQYSQDFLDSPPVQEQPYAAFRHELKSDPSSIDTVSLYTDRHQLDVERTDGTFTTSDYPPKDEQSLRDQIDQRNVNLDETSDGGAGDAVAQQLIDDSTAHQVGTALLFPAVLGFIVALVYIPLHAMRAGLLPRFFGTLGMALGASLILLPFSFPATLIWFVYLGLLYLGLVPRGRPPAWAAGVAVPWPAPGEEAPPPPPAPGGAIEGEATELEAKDNTARRERAKKRKRKRRR
jgi:hypothetical protein